jgi:hypothetical protein
MPPSWVPRLSIPRDVYDMRCPKVGSVDAHGLPATAATGVPSLPAA